MTTKLTNSTKEIKFEYLKDLIGLLSLSCSVVFVLLVAFLKSRNGLEHLDRLRREVHHATISTTSPG